MLGKELTLLIRSGIDTRENGNYIDGEKILKQSFQEALISKQTDLILESANQLSIQYRLLAGRFNRQGKIDQARAYAEASLDIYQTIQKNNLFNDSDPGLMRNLGHAVLYAGKIEEAIPILRKSHQIQTNLASKGDESCHLAAALIENGDLQEAKKLLEEGLNLILNNDGSKIWLTFGLMTKATLLTKQGKILDAKRILDEADLIAQQNNLAVRQEEIEYLMSKISPEIGVLQTVGV